MIIRQCLISSLFIIELIAVEGWGYNQLPFRLEFIDINQIYEIKPLKRLLSGYKKVKFEYYQFEINSYL